MNTDLKTNFLAFGRSFDDLVLFSGHEWIFLLSPYNRPLRHPLGMSLTNFYYGLTK